MTDIDVDQLLEDSMKQVQAEEAAAKADDGNKEQEKSEHKEKEESSSSKKDRKEKSEKSERREHRSRRSSRDSRERSPSSHRHRHHHHHHHRESSEERRRRKEEERKRDEEKRRERRERERADLEARRRKREEEEYERELRSVMVSNIVPKATLEQIKAFFEQAGKVKKVNLVTDRFTKKHKGLGYIEYEKAESIPQAIRLSGQPLLGYPVSVELSQAEKNRAAEIAARQEIGPVKMYVSNIHPNLQESDIRELFENFGKILDFALRKENGKGVATIQYANGENARTARETLNGKEICGMKINISMSLQNVIEKIGNDELDEKSGVALDNTSRVQLMQRLAGNIPSEQSQINQITVPTVPTVTQNQPSRCVLLKNMFDPKTETDPNFADLIREDVYDECSNYGKVLHVYVERYSQGEVYLCMSKVSEADEVIKHLNGRWFAKRLISADYIPEETYKIKFPGL